MQYLNSNHFGLVFLVSVCLLILSACYSQNTTATDTRQSSNTSNGSSMSDNEDSEQKAESLYLAINQLIENKACASNDDCALLAVGSRPCGGPETYRVYSKSQTNSKELKSLTKQYNQLMKNINETEGRVGICVVAPQPKFSCANNVCRADHIAGNATH